MFDAPVNDVWLCANLSIWLVIFEHYKSFHFPDRKVKPYHKITVACGCAVHRNVNKSKVPSYHGVVILHQPKLLLVI